MLKLHERDIMLNLFTTEMETGKLINFLKKTKKNQALPPENSHAIHPDGNDLLLIHSPLQDRVVETTDPPAPASVRRGCVDVRIRPETWKKSI